MAGHVLVGAGQADPRCGVSVVLTTMKGSPMEILFYTPEDAAHLLSIGRTKVFELMASGELQSVQIGRARRIPRESLEDFATRLRTQGSDNRA